MKQTLREKGVLCYDDAYILAMKAMKTYPILKCLLQKRFRYVFVDEMQDMDSHQYHLLEQIFFDGGNSSSIYQRIGDKNQAIFSGDVKLEEIWKNRTNVLPITGSCRLSSIIAKVVQSFGMPCVSIVGRNSGDGNLPPHIIVFDDNSVLNVLPKFCELVRKYIDEGKIPKNHKHPIKAIAWRKGEDGKFGLKNYWPEFETNASKSQTDYPNLKSYMLFAKKEDSQNNNLESIHKSILDAFLRVLRLEQVENPDSKPGHFSNSSLRKHLKDNHIDFYEDFRLRLFRWCRDIYSEKINDAFSDIKNFIPQFLKCFGKKLEKAVDFVNDESSQTISKPSDKSGNTKAKDNIYRCEKTGIKVEVGTVHSVKGKTHTATLYLESYYYQDGRGQNAKSYESQRLKKQFTGQPIPDNAGDRIKQSARMVYVGFSRPTHLLCFAVHKDRFDKKVFGDNGWQICMV
jgi:superfamily I DNA/RNA helicase